MHFSYLDLKIAPDVERALNLLISAIVGIRSWQIVLITYLNVIERQTRERQQMIQVCSLLMMFMYIYNGKGCNLRDTTVSEGVDQEEQP
jgi:hypothetical protein